MKCYYCQSELIEYFLGTCCTNEKCNSVDGITRLIIYPGGSREWYKNDKLHRANGPAIERPDGTKYWYFNNLLHREDGPAAETLDGSKYWYKDGKKHRENGPAIEFINGQTEYWVNGEKIIKWLI